MSRPGIDNELVGMAREACAQAYATYSIITVGAAVRTDCGAVYTGRNVENASFGLTQCAERNAIAAAVQAEGEGMRISAVACVSSASGAFTPCGACRQVTAEFSEPGTLVFYSGGDGQIACETMAGLLPHACGLG